MSQTTPRATQQTPASKPCPSIEPLESRRHFSGSVEAVALNAVEGAKFRDVVGSWTVEGGLPTHASGISAVAVIDWGDGKTSHAKLVDDGSGVVQIIGSHTWKHAGTFQTVVKVEEYPRAHHHQITEIGQGDASAVVAPKPVKISVKGNATGDYTIPLGNPEVRSYVFTGTGTSRALGAVTLSGTITPPGFIRSAPATGEITLTGATGSVTIDLTGHPQDGGSPVPQKMTYTIVSGTGAFSNPGGKGTVSIALDTTANTFVFVIH